MKSEFYLATVVSAYRRLLDGDPSAAEELEAVSHRSYTTAYALGENHETTSPETSQCTGTREFVALVLGWERGRAVVEMRNRFREGETLELFSPRSDSGSEIAVLHLMEGEEGCTDAKHVQGIYSFDCPPVHAGDLFRRKI